MIKIADYDEFLVAVKLCILRKFLEKKPPEKVRKLIEESGIEFPEDPFNPFKSDAHCQSYFRRVQNLLLNEQKQNPDESEETSPDDATEEGSPESAAGPCSPLNSGSRHSEGEVFLSEERGGLKRGCLGCGTANDRLIRQKQPGFSVRPALFMKRPGFREKNARSDRRSGGSPVAG